MITADHLNALVATSHIPAPLDWSPWPERAGWMRAPAGTGCYEIGKHIINADHGLTYMVDERRGRTGAERWVLLVGPRP